MNFTQILRCTSGIFFYLIILTFPAISQERPTIDSIKTQYVDEVVVSATRSEVFKEKLPQTIHVISSKDLKMTEGQEFADFLKKNSSINVVQYPGLLTGVGIRGFGPQTAGLNQRTLILVDGRPAGATSLGTINQGNIERIEILKGPASALYGAQAMGGVVNIITKRSTGRIIPSFYMEYGSYKTLKLGASAGGKLSSKLDFDLSFNLYNRDKDYKLGNGNVFRDILASKWAEKTYFDGSKTMENDSRGDGTTRDYTKLNYKEGSFRIGYQLSNKLKLEIKGGKFMANNVQSPSDLAFGNLFPGLKDLDRNTAEIMASAKLKRHDMSFKIYGANEITAYKTSLEKDPYVSYNGISEWVGFQLKDVYQVGKQTLVVGLDQNQATSKTENYGMDRARSAPYSPNYSLITTGLYAQGQISLHHDQLMISPGVRFDHIVYNVKATPLLDNKAASSSNPFFSPSLGVQYGIMDKLKIHSTIGRAFVTPDAYNVAGKFTLATPGWISVYQGNPDLKNEKSITWDAGLRYQNSRSGLSLDVTYFSTIVKDRITTQSSYPSNIETTEKGDTINSYVTYINSNNAKINGLELEGSYDLGSLKSYQYSLRLFFNSTFIFNAKEIIKTGTKEKERSIYNVAQSNITYGLDFNNYKGLNLRLSARYVGHKQDMDFNDPKYPDIQYPRFMVMDFSASYSFRKKHRVSLFVNNLTDENYYEKRGYNMPGRNFSLRYTFTFPL